jgi:autotransporter-associated beta strand protein
VDLDGFGIITYEGLNPINNSGSATAVVFNLPTADADVAAVLEDHADTSTITFRSQPANADFETANVVAPSNSLSIFPGQATHTLAIEDLTKFNSAASLTAGSSSLSFATVNLNGSISLASLSVFGSTINSAASETITISSGNTFTATAGSGGGTLAGVIAGAGAFTKDGPGNLASSGINTYSGDTTISAGTLSLTASGSSNPISDSPTINIASGATLDVNALNSSTLRLSNTPTDGQTLLGSGTLTGNLEVASGTTLSPSTSSSILTVGALSFTGGTYSVQIAGDDAGTQYDQVQATSVSLGSGVATLHLSVSADVSLFSEYVIINNSGSANTTGFFSGLAEGSSLIINGETLYISYNGGDGNDVVLLGTPQISGTTGDDTINVTWNGTAFSAVVNGGTPANLGSAVNFRIRSYNGADIVNIDFGNQPIASFNIDYNGGLPTTAPGDALTVSATGGSTTTVTHTFTNSSAGQIQLAGNISGNIFYAGLEPVTDNINAQNRIFQLNNTAQTLQLNNNSAPSGNQLLIDSDQSESVLFLNPTVSLAIYGGAAADIFNIESLNSQLNAHVTIDGNGGNDSANLAVTAALILAASRNLTVTAENIAQTNALTVPGVTSLTAISTSNISLTNASNDFTTFAVNAANNVSVVDANGIVVNASAISGDLSISAGSAVTFAQNVTAGGNLTVTAADVAGTGDDITVNASVTVSADNVVFNAGDAISMGANSRVQATVAGGDVTFTADATSADSNGGMTLDGQIQATTGTVTLQLNTRGPATQTSNATTWIRASELLLLSSTNDTADFNLDSIGNRIATLAAATSGDVVVRDEDSGLIIGNIGGAGGTNGITTGTGLSAPSSGGLVTINMPNGIITVQQPISTTPPASVGTATINISGSVLIDNTITAEGGNVTLNGNSTALSDITVNFNLTSGGDMTLSAPAMCWSMQC